MGSAVAFRAGKASSASWDMTNAKWLIVVDMANVLMGNVFVPEDTQDLHANKVSLHLSIIGLTQYSGFYLILKKKIDYSAAFKNRLSM